MPLMAAQWVPERWIGDNPVGLGLLAWFGTYMGLLVCGYGDPAPVQVGHHPHLRACKPA